MKWKDLDYADEDDDDDKLCIIKNFTFRYLTCRVQRIRYKTRRILAFSLCIFAIFTPEANKQCQGRIRAGDGLKYSWNTAGVAQKQSWSSEPAEP